MPGDVGKVVVRNKRLNGFFRWRAIFVTKEVGRLPDRSSASPGSRWRGGRGSRWVSVVLPSVNLHAQMAAEAPLILLSEGSSLSARGFVTALGLAGFCRGEGPAIRPLAPNAETFAAMRAARRGDVVTAGKPSKRLASLIADRSVHEPLQTGFPAREIRTLWQEAG